LRVGSCSIEAFDTGSGAASQGASVYVRAAGLGLCRARHDLPHRA
jgi:hypothetical protein